jgi:hypothetical protein
MEDKIRKAIKEEIAKLHVAETMSPEEWEAAKEADRLDQHPEKDTINKIKQMMDKEEDDKEQAEYDKGWYGESSDYADRLANSGTDSDGRNTWGDKTGYSDEEMAQGKGKLKKYPDKDGRNVWGDKTDYSDAEKKAKSLKEIASELGYLKEDYKPSHRAYNVIDKSNNDKIVAKELSRDKALELAHTNKDYMISATDRLAEESNQYQKASFVYTEQGGRFYSLTLSTSDGQTLKMKYDEANEWVKKQLEYIHEGDLLPRRYNSGLEDLDLIVARLKELGIEASHGDYMDVS